MSSRRALLAGAAGTIVAIAILGAGAAHADTPAFVEHIERYDVTMTVARDGTMTVRESIAYDFGVTPRHGIFRDIPDHELYLANRDYDRVYKISSVQVTADPGVSVATKRSHQGRYVHLRIGDPNRTISGTHRYTIDYTVRGALTPFASHDELNWDAIGTQWNVPIDHATVTLVMPASITRIACYTGPEGSHLVCDTARHSGTRATFSQDGLDSEDGLTIVAAIPKGVVTPAPVPILQKHWNLDDAFARRPDTVVPGGAIALLGIGGVVALAWKRGRDRQYRGSAVDQAMGNASGADEAVPLLHREAGPVEFVPPDGIRPGQVGVLVDEQANVLDVTATIIDLAVRGYLRITELPPEGLLRRRHDYELQKLDAPENAKPLLPYEQKVLSGLFSTGDDVHLSDLKYKFRAELVKVQDTLYKDAVSEGWYRTRPDRTRALWHGVALFLLVAGVVATVFVARSTSYGLVPLGVALTGLVLLTVAHRMPARTAKGSAALSRVRGFRRLFDEGDEALRSRFAEEHDIFSRYLPYAIVFGCAKKWAKVFEGLDAEALGSTGWYRGTDTLNAFALANAMDDFGTVATGTLYASQPSSSGSSGFGGGFSGGGGGGGGGGSW